MDFISSFPLFRGCTDSEAKDILKIMDILPVHFVKGSYILKTGDTTNSIGLVLRGSIRIENNDVWGNTSVLSIVQAGGVFAESYACLKNQPLMVDVIANADSEILFVDMSQLDLLTGSAARLRSLITENLLRISARKNLTLSRRIFHTSSKSIRGRLLSYFSEQAALQNSTDFTIAMNRQQLADYLNVDRSALSKELGKMKSDGLIDYHKNHFRILANEL